MRRAWRLRANEDFQRVRREGRSWAHPLLVLVAADGRDPDGRTRLGITVSRRVGKAVIRNRIKRRVRELLRLRYARIAPGQDLVFVVRPYAARANYRALEEAVESLLERAGLLRAEVPCGSSPSS